MTEKLAHDCKKYPAELFGRKQKNIRKKVKKYPEESLS